MNISSYDIFFDIDFKSLSYEARERIHVENPEKSISLDCLGLNIRKVSVDGKGSQFSHDEKRAKLIINNPLSGGSRPDAITIAIDFTGKVSEGALHGLYKSSYSGGYLLSTDLEPIGARRVFPCKDDPNYKAVFNVEVLVDSKLEVIANTSPKQIEELYGNKKRIAFYPTPKMSTYLFYLGVGEFDQLALDKDGVEYIAATSPNNAQKGKFALENAILFLREYEEYFGIKYPLKKLHLIAVPEYPSGAMENWGAITFREVALLVDLNSSASNKKRAVAVIGHEIAHQWFGNLVTMRWWNDLWLNESFATFMESKMVERIHPEWNIWSDFLLEETAGAMKGDSLSTTHPIDAKVESPEEVSQIFDVISYGKGASIIKMIEAYVGEEEFRRGVSGYLKTYSYGNAEGKDLWQSISKASNKPIDEMMSAWITKPGYPVIEASYENGKLLLKQRRFALSEEKTRSGELWPVPIAALINGKLQRILLRNETVDLSVGSSLTQLKINVGQTGFYRVLYSESLYRLIESEFDTLDRIDKWGILNDLFAFLLAGLISQEIYFRFLAKARNLKDYIVVESITTQLRTLYLISPSNQRILEEYEEFHKVQIERLGLESRAGEPDTDAILRGKVASNLASVDDSFAHGIADRFAEYDRVDPNIRSAVAIAFARVRGSAGFEPLVLTARKMGNEADLIKIFDALTSFRDPQLVEKALDLSMSGEFNRADALYAIFSAAENPDAREAVWKWTIENLQRIRETFAGTYIVSNVLEDVISSAGLGREEKVNDYFSKTTIEEGTSGIRKGLELLRVYSELARRLER